MAHHGSESIDPRIKILQGDITALEVDAIVNAANRSLLGGGGVDGAIHRAAGPELRKFNKTLSGCDTGDAKISPGFNLKARHVISTVGPVWKDGHSNEDNLLASCYQRSLEVAVENDVTTIAFPCISTGAYGFPFERAEKIALDAIHEFLSYNTTIQEVIIIAFGKEDFSTLSDIHQNYNPHKDTT